METTTTTVKEMGRAVARVQGDGIYLTGTGLFLFIILVIAIGFFAVIQSR